MGTVAARLFAKTDMAAYDGATVIEGGVFLDSSVKQLGICISEALVGFIWSFVRPYILLLLSTAEGEADYHPISKGFENLE